jgi:hypothetical protein
MEEGVVVDAENWDRQSARGIKADYNDDIVSLVVEAARMLMSCRLLKGQDSRRHARTVNPGHVRRLH